MSVIGVPIKVLHEAEGHIVTVETTTGEVSPLVTIIRPSESTLRVGLYLVCETKIGPKTQFPSKK